MPTFQSTYQGTTTFNNLVIRGCLTVDDLSTIKSKTGIIETSLRYKTDAGAIASNLPVDKLSGNYMMTFAGFDKYDTFRVT